MKRPVIPWTRVSETLPPDNVYVLAVVDNDTILDVLVYLDSLGAWTDAEGLHFGRVTHWSLPPAPPEIP